ncbi:hypothetical protein BG000_004272, partial [Podila horticola]
MPSPHLPPECIHLIAKHLHLIQAYSTLCTLLRTNKTMFTLVAPIVFGEPFQQHELPKAKLCRLLLSCRPVEQLPALLKIAYFPEYLSPSMDHPCTSEQETTATSAPLPSTSVDYSSLIKHMNFSCKFISPTASFQSGETKLDMNPFLTQSHFERLGNPHIAYLMLSLNRAF